MSSTNLEIRSGMAFVYNGEKDYSTSVTFALSVIALNPNWAFSRDTTIDVADLRLLLAEDYFALEEYSSSLTQVVLLDSSFSASLDVSTVAGQTTLAQEIERLREII